MDKDAFLKYCGTDLISSKCRQIGTGSLSRFILDELFVIDDCTSIFDPIALVGISENFPDTNTRFRNKAQWKQELNQVGHCRKPKNV